VGCYDWTQFDGHRVDVQCKGTPRGIFSVHLSTDFALADDARMQATTTISSTAPEEEKPFPRLKALDLETVAETLWNEASRKWAHVDPNR